jgi:hypothetical protein
MEVAVSPILGCASRGRQDRLHAELPTVRSLEKELGTPDPAKSGLAREYTFRGAKDGPTPNEVTSMGKPLHLGAALLFCVPTLVLALQDPTPAGGVPASVAASGPATIATEGLIKLDVVVTDQSGKSVAGLKPTDFTLLDNEQPQKILSFETFNGEAIKPDPPVEVILVIDTVNLPTNQIPLAKSEADKFLRRNHGHLGPTCFALPSFRRGAFVYARSLH